MIIIRLHEILQMKYIFCEISQSVWYRVCIYMQLDFLSGPFGRDSSTSGPDLASHFSVSLDYGPESPLNVDQISFNSLKERVELILTSGEEEGRQGSFGSTVSPVNTESVYRLRHGLTTGMSVHPRRT